jgi:hypothetical protein
MSKQKTKNNQSKEDTSSMNDALKQWLSESDQTQLSQKIEQKLQGKKPEGPCAVCGVNTAKAVCIKCGSSVCISCYFNIVGLCRKCLSKESLEQWQAKKPNWETILGVDWVD